MSDISYATAEGPVKAYLAEPQGAGPWPGVVVVMDVFGLSDDIRAQCDRLAGEGYLGLAPDFYSRGSKVTCIRAMFGTLRRGEGRPFRDIEAARSWLGERPDCTKEIGVVGFCIGGGFALLAAARYGFSASSVNYGQVPADADRLLQGSCPIVASYGARDQGLKGQAQRLEQALESLGIEHDIKEYPGVGHGFMNHHRGPLGAALRVFGVRYDPARRRTHGAESSPSSSSTCAPAPRAPLRSRRPAGSSGDGGPPAAEAAPVERAWAWLPLGPSGIRRGYTRPVARRSPRPAVIAALLCAHLVVTAFTWRDLRHRTQDQVRGSKRLWRVLSAANMGNSAAYFLFGRKRTA